jgi:hypothetical protein
MRTKAKIAAALLAGMVVFGSGMPQASAGQTPVTVADPAGDGTGAGDILGLRVFQNPAQSYALTLQVRTAAPINLQQNVAFTREASKSELRFNLDTDGDAGFEYVVFIEPGEEGAAVRFHSVDPLAPEGLCSIGLTQPTAKSIRLTFGGPCFLVPQVRATARYRLDFRGDGSVNSDDRVPNGGWSPALNIVS